MEDAPLFFALRDVLAADVVKVLEAHAIDVRHDPGAVARMQTTVGLTVAEIAAFIVLVDRARDALRAAERVMMDAGGAAHIATIVEDMRLRGVDAVALDLQCLRSVEDAVIPIHFPK